jgi:LEA14-like dessication related protein
MPAHLVFNISVPLHFNPLPYLTPMKCMLVVFTITVLFLSACSTLKAPGFLGVGNVDVAQAGLKATTLKLDLFFNNPNNTKARLTGGSGQVWLDQTLLGDFLLDTTVAIPARADFSVPVKLTIEMKKVLKNSLQVLFSDSLPIRLAGEARVSKGAINKKIPLSYQGKISLNQLMTADTLRIK